MNELLLRLLLRILGWMCILALISLFMPRNWLDSGHRLLGLGEYPKSPIAEYLRHDQVQSDRTGILWGRLRVRTGLRHFQSYPQPGHCRMVRGSTPALLRGSYTGFRERMLAGLASSHS